MTAMRTALVVLLAAATALFVVGVVLERSQTREPAHVEAQAAGETGEAEETHTAEHEAVSGVDVESVPSIVLAVVIGLGLAALVATRFGRPPGVLLAVALIA